MFVQNRTNKIKYVFSKERTNEIIMKEIRNAGIHCNEINGLKYIKNLKLLHV